MKNTPFLLLIILLFACSDNKDDGGETPPPYYNPVEGIWQVIENGKPINIFDIYTEEFINYIRSYNNEGELSVEKTSTYKIDSDSIWYYISDQFTSGYKWEVEADYLYLSQTEYEITRTDIYIKVNSTP